MNTKQELIALCNSVLIPKSTDTTITGIQEELASRLPISDSEILTDFMLDIRTGTSESLMAYYPNNLEGQFNALINEIKQALETDSIDQLDQKKQGTLDQLRDKISLIEDLIITGMSKRCNDALDESYCELSSEELEACTEVIGDSIRDFCEISRECRLNGSYRSLNAIMSSLELIQEEVHNELIDLLDRERINEVLESAKTDVRQYFADIQGKLDQLSQGLNVLIARSVENKRLADFMNQPLTHDQIVALLQQMIDRLSQEQKEEARRLFK